VTGWTEGLSWLFAALTGAGVIYTLGAAAAALSFFARRPSPREVEFPAVSLIKPLHGAPEGLAESLQRFCEQDYAGPVQIVFGVHDASDAAVAVVERLKHDNPMADIALVVDSRLHGANRKASNLINIMARARHDLLVVSDADIRVERDYLRRVAKALAEPGVGAVTCLYVGYAGRRIWARLAAMGIDYHFLPGAVLGKTIGLAHPCFGSTIALSRETLGQIGGFAAFANHLADDYEIGRAVRSLGLSVAIPNMVVAHRCDESSRRELIGHEIRWGMTTRQIDPAGYAGSVITYPTPLALITALAAGFPPWSLGLILVSLASRLCLKLCVDAATGARAGPWWLMPWRDLVSFGVFLASFTVRTVGWHGQRFRVGRDGVLLHG
jgi:ceramide glucosyltransferase